MRFVVGVLFRLYTGLLSFYSAWFLPASPQGGTVDAEIKVLFVENPELTNVLRLNPGVGQNVASCVSPTAKNFFLFLISTSSVHTYLFFFLSLQILSLQTLSLLFSWVIANADSRVGARNKVGHSAHGHKRCRQVPVASGPDITVMPVDWA